MQLIIIGFAAYAIAHYITREMGPGNILQHIRDLSTKLLGGHTPLYCPYCTLPYAAVLAWVVIQVAPQVGLIVSAVGVGVALLELTKDPPAPAGMDIDTMYDQLMDLE